MCSKDLKIELPNWLVRNENTSQGLMESTKHCLLYSLQLGSAAASDLANIWQEGAVPSQTEGAASPFQERALITLEGTAGFHLGVPPEQKPLASPGPHTSFGENSTICER